MPERERQEIRLDVSTCALGEKVGYDAGHEGHAEVRGCPEVDWRAFAEIALRNHV